jgi:hypothetical protein
MRSNSSGEGVRIRLPLTLMGVSSKTRQVILTLSGPKRVIARAIMNPENVKFRYASPTVRLTSSSRPTSQAWTCDSWRRNSACTV